MPLVIGVRFSPAAKIYYFDPAGFEDLKTGEHVIVETARGEEAGQVVIGPREVTDQEIVGKLKGVQRRATALDLTQLAGFRYREQEALERCAQKVAEHGLPMKMVRAEYNYDGSRLVFYFVSEARVDFRELVRDLAQTFKARIELRQIGVRDEAKLLGGLGRCGQTLCCSTWLTDFHPVSIKMAKQQDLPLSPMEISGVCGRLLCCLAYENETYIAAKQTLPKQGEMLETPHGPGKIVQVNVIKETVQVELESQVIVEVSYQDVETKAASVGRRRRRRPEE
jgi:cell fate regulator YaaT (PSP1 superfamily)